MRTMGYLCVAVAALMAVGGASAAAGDNCSGYCSPHFSGCGTGRICTAKDDGSSGWWCCDAAAIDADASGACVSDADTAVWNDHLATFNDEMKSCGMGCILKSDFDGCVSSCMVKKDGYSQACGDCLGALSGCTKTNCMTKCANPESDDCKECVKEHHCDDDWTTCSGLDAPSSHLTMPLVAGNTTVFAADTTAACAGDADTAAWNAHLATFEKDMTDCAMKSLLKSGDAYAKAVSACMADKDGFSDGCSQCLGALSGCTKTNCYSKCISAESDACKECVKENCDADFTSCSGLAPPS